MDSADGSEHRGIEEERSMSVSDNLLEELTSISESDKEESTNGITDEVPEYRSRSREEAGIGSSVAPRAGDSGVTVETERESESTIALVPNTAVEKENHQALDFEEKNQEDTHEIHVCTPTENTLNLDIVTEIEASNESLVALDFTNDQTEAEDDKILGMNIKVAADDDDTVEESVPCVLMAAREENAESDESVNSEEVILVPEIASAADFSEFESAAIKEILENNAKLNMNADAAAKEDAEETNQEKTQSSETENIVSVAVVDDFDIETTDVSVTEADVNVGIEKEEEKVLEMNIRVEEGKTKQVGAEKESELDTSVDQKKSHEVVDLKEKLTKLEELSFLQQGEIYETDLLATSDIKPVTKLDFISLQTDTVEGVLVSAVKEDEADAELEGMLSMIKPAESPVPFVPNGIEEAIEFIDSETLELKKRPPSNVEHPTETVADSVSDASLAPNSGRLVSDKGSLAHGEELESTPVVPPRPLQPLNTSSPHLAGSSNDNIFGSSTEATKSTGSSRIRKPEWMRRSFVRNGSVRRLFSRMRSKRFDHDQHPVTPAPEPRPPQRPFRQMIVDFLLLLFES